MGDLSLKELKEIYSALEKKYSLPSFEELNENFEIDKIDREREHILRAVRKSMMDKIVNFTGFFEMLLNPVNAPRLYAPFISSMSAEDKKLIDSVYDKLGDLSLESFELEVDYSEEKEGEMIKKVSKTWNSLKSDLKKIFGHVKKPESLGKKERGYFG